MHIAPEIIAEQVMGYVVWAAQLIPTLKPSAKKTYSVAIIPQGPHFYTGLLQAAGYLLLDSKKKKVLIISQQSEDIKHILVDNNVYGPIFGQYIKSSSNKITKFAREIDAIISTSQQKLLAEYINFQLPFLRVISTSKEILHISIGEKSSKTSLNKVLKWIKNHKKEYNIVFLTNIELIQAAKSKKNDEQEKIAKIIQTSSEKKPLLTLFQKTLDSQKKRPQIIAYVNPADFGKATSLTTRYICAVG